jgi:uncharacterized protein YmfQ (DUF2313 family)
MMAIIPIYGASELGATNSNSSLDVTDKSAYPFVVRLFPPGGYFSRAAGWLPKTARAIARFMSRLTRRRAAFVLNMDPRQADELLDEWESAYGITPVQGTTDDDRRDAVLTKVRSLGGVTAAYYEALAADFGYPDAVVTDAAEPFTTGSFCGDLIKGAEWKLTLELTAASQGAARDQQLQELIDSQLLAGWGSVYDFT